jgi:hypothetical protein
MKISRRLFRPCLLLMLASLSACRKNADVKTSVSELETAFPSASVQPPAQAQAAAPGARAQADANDFVKAALAAAHTNDYASGVIALQAALIKPGMTAEQVMTVQRAKQALLADLQRRAVNGDQQALAQLRAIEKTRSQ